MNMARVFHSDGNEKRPDGGQVEQGWYYQLNLDPPVGPFKTQIFAGMAARETIVEKADEVDTSDIPEAGEEWFNRAKLTVPARLDRRELGTVLAALRFWQWRRGSEHINERMQAIFDIADDGGDPLGDDEIDALCERLNCGAPSEASCQQGAPCHNPAACPDPVGCGQKAQEYLVRWEIDVEAMTPQQAAEKARGYQITLGTTAKVFDVFEKGDHPSDTVIVATIDLAEPENSRHFTLDDVRAGRAK